MNGEDYFRNSSEESESEIRSVVSDSLWPCGLYSPWNSSGQNTGVDSLLFLQGNSPNPGIKPRSPTLQADSLPAESQGKSKNTGVGNYPFSSGSSRPRNWTGVSCIAGELFTNWAMREALKLYNFSEYISYWISKTCVYEGAIFLVQDPRCGVSDLEVKSSAPLGK